MTASADRPPVGFVLVACPKSGTTWLSRLISAHPGLCCGESKPFGRFRKLDNPTGPTQTLDEVARDLVRHRPPPVAGEPFARRLAFELWNGVARAHLAETGAQIYGEKFTPFRGTASDAVEAIRQYEAFHGPVPLVHLVRDGRDVVASAAAHQLNIAAAAPAGASPVADSPEQARALREAKTIPEHVLDVTTETWTEVNTAMLAARDAGAAVLDLSYESMVADPVTQAGRLLRFIAEPEVSVTSESIERAVRAASFKALSGGRAAGDEDPASFFRKGVPGDWVNWFTPEQHERFLDRAGGLMRRLGYSTDERPARRAS